MLPHDIGDHERDATSVAPCASAAEVAAPRAVAIFCFGPRVMSKADGQQLAAGAGSKDWQTISPGPTRPICTGKLILQNANITIYICV